MKKVCLYFTMLLLFSACTEHKEKEANLQGMDDVIESRIDTPPAISKATIDTNGIIPRTQNLTIDDSVFIDGSRPTSWEIAGITDVKGFKLFLRELQRMIATDSKMEVAMLVKYPLPNARDVKFFFKNYNNLITASVREAVASINFRQIFRNAKGVMIGDGKLWIAQEGKGFKIIAINK